MNNSCGSSSFLHAGEIAHEEKERPQIKMDDKDVVTLVLFVSFRNWKERRGEKSDESWKKRRRDKRRVKEEEKYSTALIAGHYQWRAHLSCSSVNTQTAVGGSGAWEKKVQQIFFFSKYSYKTLGIFIGRPVNVSMDQSLLARWSACHSRLCQCWYLRPRRFLLFVDFMTLSVPFLTSNYHKRCW